MSENTRDANSRYDHPGFDREAAMDYTGMSRHQLDRARWGKKINYFLVGNVVKYSQRQLDEYLESCRVDNTSSENAE
ncbi:MULTISPECIES: hypothetical protein [unclassified Microbacterium]|uniref:hypothetical protein n=1 Tax=unclassified Microbacterium TaxID=2609290 RepID=UPI00301B649B